MLTSIARLRGLAVAALLQLIAAPAQSQTPQPLRLRIDASRRANAVYHLACLARSINCTHEIFERFWQQRLVWTPAEQTALETWRQVMAALTAAAPPRSGLPMLGNTVRFHPAQATRGIVFIAAVTSSSARELQQRSRGALTAQAATRLEDAIDQFERRLEPWWESERHRRRATDERLSRVVERARETGMPQLMSSVASFLQAHVAESDLYLHAILAPEPTSPNYAATQSGSHFFVEAVDEVTTDAFIHGAVHELTHYLYDSAPHAKHVELVRQFAQSGVTSFAGLYAYLNEAVAVAAQGLYAQGLSGSTGESQGYNHPYIRPLGVAATPLLKSAIAQQQTLFSGFAAGFIAAGEAALGEKLLEPRFVLSQVALLLPANAEPLAAAYFAKMFPQVSAQFRRQEEVAAFPDLNVVRFVPYEELETLASQLPEIGSLHGRRGFAYALKRGPRAFTYVLAGRDTDALIQVITELAAMQRLSGQGLLFALDR